MKDKKDKIYYFQEKSNDILDLQDDLTTEEIGIYFILKAGYYKYSGELTRENVYQRCKFFGDKAKMDLMVFKLFDLQDGLLVNSNWLSEINGIKQISKKRKEIAEKRWSEEVLKKGNKIEKKKDNPDKPKKTQSVFIKPTIQEIKDYCFERKNNIDAEHFFNYYETRNWKDIKNWRACIITWEKNKNKFTNNNNQNKTQGVSEWKRIIS